jgi:hypothetical protein
MRQLVAGLLAIALFTAAGCSSDSNTCADLGGKLEACLEVPAEAGELMCNEIDCTISKQAAIDCIMDKSCAELEAAEPLDCYALGGCTPPDV